MLAAYTKCSSSQQPRLLGLELLRAEVACAPRGLRRRGPHQFAQFGEVGQTRLLGRRIVEVVLTDLRPSSSELRAERLNLNDGLFGDSFVRPLPTFSHDVPQLLGVSSTAPAVDRETVCDLLLHAFSASSESLDRSSPSD